nr:amyloid-beta A4 precursor protein-binding family A member 2-like [Salvelinus alpinus]
MPPFPSAAQLIAQSSDRPFSVAYREFLRANGINPKGPDCSKISPLSVQMPHDISEQQPGRPHCPEPQALQKDSNNTPQPEPTQNNASFPSFVDVPGPCEPEDLIDGIIFAANYLGSTQLLSDKNPSKGTRMAQAQEAVSQVKVVYLLPA